MSQPAQPHPLGEVWRGVKRGTRLLWASGRGLASATWAWVVLRPLLTLGAAIASANAVGAAPNVIRHGLDTADGRRLIAAAIAFGVLFGVQSLGGSFAETFMRRVGRRVDGSARERVMRAALRPTGIRHLEDPEMQAAFNAARNISPIGLTPSSAVEQLPWVIGERVLVIGYLGVLTYIAWPIGLAMTAAAVANQSEMSKMMRRTALRSAGWRPVAVPTYFRDMAVTAPFAKEVRVFGLASWLRGRYQDAQDEIQRDADAQAPSDYSRALIGLLAVDVLLAVGALIVLGRAAIRGDVGVGELALGVTAIMALSPRLPVADFVLAYGTLAADSIESAERLVADEPADRGDRDEVVGGPGVIRFEDVSFRYPGTELDVLSGLSIELRAGERTALVGVNGAGKTTIVKLLCKFYEPTGGRILVDGVDLADVGDAGWRARLAVLFQDFVHYELPVRDNVGFGAVKAAPDEERLDAVAARIGADRIVHRLPAGWDTPLSARFTGGTDLSGGEWQRVAFARALYAVEAGASVLVLDEPTANLDVRAEAELYDQFAALTGGGRALTTLLISHRFSTVRQADRIVVLADGRVSEEGSHTELMAAGGTYAQMFTAQAAHFAESTPAEEVAG